MRILRLDLTAYGRFTDVSLDLAADSPGLHVVFGENEAGKSTTLRALKGLLYGIAARTDDNFLHPNPKLRVGALLAHSDGRRLEVVRRKGNKDTLLDADGDALPDDTLLAYLPSADGEVFSSLYGIDHDALVAGGREILDAEGDVGKVLFSAASGIGRLTEVLAGLDGAAAALFKPRASSAEVNKAVARFKDARKAAKEATLKIADWTGLQVRHQQVEDALAEVEARLATAKANKSKLERLKRVLAPLAERREVLCQIEAMRDVVRLPAEAPAERKEALGKLQAAQNILALSQGKHRRATLELEKLGAPSPLCGSAQTVKALTKQLGAVEKADKDLVTLEAKQRQAKNEAKAALQRVRPDLTLDQVEVLRPLLNGRKNVATLAEEWRSHERSRQESTKRIRKLEADFDGIRADVAKLGATPDLTFLKAALADARAQGELDVLVAKASREVARAEKKVEAQLVQLAPYSGSLAGVLSRSLPADGVLDHFEHRLARLEEDERDRGRERRNHEQERIDVDAQLGKLLRDGMVPSDDSLGEARQRREQGWRLVRRSWLHGQDVAAEASELLGDHTLPDGYEGLVSDADRVADALRHDGKRVHERAALEAQLGKLDRQLELLTEAEVGAAARRRDWTTEWNAAWAQWDFAPTRPEQMKAWTARAATLVELAERLDELRQEAGALIDAREQHRESLLALAVRPPSAAKDGALAPLIAHCDRQVERAEQLANEHRQATNTLARINEDLAGARQDLAGLDASVVTWRAAWAAAIAGLQLDAEAPPALVESMMEQLTLLFTSVDTNAELGRRLFGIRKDVERFEGQVQSFVERTGYARGDRPWVEVAARLGDELEAATKVEARRGRLADELSGLEDDIATAKIEVAAAEARLVELRARAGVQTDAALEQAEARSAEVAALEDRRRQLEQQLRVASDGLSMYALEEEAEGVNPDELPGQLEQVDDDIGLLATQRDELRDQRTTVAETMKRHDGHAAAAGHEQEAESALAEIRDGATRYLRLSIASLVLQREIESYRAANQAPVLERAGQLFARLTLGSFSGLRDELDSRGKPILLGIRADADEVGVDGMSDGTRDQLFLALRLAILEQTVDKGMPVPFVVDDILVGFDDDRTQACLEVLAELGGKTQILLFTHHKSVAEAAERLGSGRGVFVHTLAAG